MGRRERIEMDDRLKTSEHAVGGAASARDDLTCCVEFLAEERYGKDAAEKLLIDARGDADRLFNWYRELVNVREPKPVPKDILDAQDRMLRRRIADAGVTEASALPRTPVDERISVWRGDITTLAVDVIVNAANSQMLGCWVPGHYCIDNAIHTFAGVQLRAECARLMREQGYAEPTGMAKVTSAYNLPSKWVIHTVGPIANGTATEADRGLLACSYRSCLDAAREIGAKSIAFCCISTGVFGFPQHDAAKIAVQTVREWLDCNAGDIHVIFNVFGQKDEDIYHELLFR